MSRHNSTVYRKKNFVSLDRNLVRTPTLSCKAKCLLFIGLSHSENWHFSKKQMATCFLEGSHTVDQAMKELRDAGYLYLTHKYEGKKLRGWHYHWFDEPISEEEFEEFKKSFRNPENPDDWKIGATESLTDIRKESSKETNSPKKTTTPPKAEAASRVVVFSCLDRLEIPDKLKQKISREHSEADVEQAVERTIAWETRSSDRVGILTCLMKKDTWNDEVATEEAQGIKILNRLKQLDGKEKRGFNIRVNTSAENPYFEASHGNACKTFYANAKNFIAELTDFLMQTLKIRLKEINT